VKYKFQWDTGNAYKSLVKHGISNNEAQSVFNDNRKIIQADIKHSDVEIRYICIGLSFEGRILMTVFTIRRRRIRIISSRVANKKERIRYAV
jgi:uncharacterized DUF497 family protein